jgi:hypothetical protein
VASKIQIRRDTVANWNAVSGSVILAAGEIGYETDTRNLKIGDGTNVWSALKYQAPVYSGTNSTLAAATLAVDQTNNRVGIGTASPQVKLHTAVLDPTNGIVEIVQNTAGVTGSQIQITQSTIQDWAIGQPAATDAFAFWRGRNTSAGGNELMRISSTGNVGIGTSAPLDQLHIQGATPIIRLKDTTSTTAEYAQIDASNSTGSILIAADPGNTTASTTAAISVDGTTRLSVGTTGVAITGTLSTSGVYSANAGITVPTGQTVTISSGATLSVPSGATLSVAGTVALPAGSVEIADLANIATLTVLGNSTGAAAAVTALTSGVAGTAKTALGLANSAYSGGVYKLSESGLIGLVLSNASPPLVTVNITSNLVDVEYWYRVTSTTNTSGGPRTAEIYFNAPATNGLVVKVESNFGIGSATLTTSSGTSYGFVFAASAQALVTLSNTSLAGVAQCWISVKKIVIA